MTAREGTGSSLMLAPIVTGLRALGHDPSVLLARHGVEPCALDDPRRRLDNATLLALWRDAPAVAGDENFGIRAAMHYAPGMFHVLDYVVSAAPTLGDAFERVVPHVRLLHDHFQVELAIDGESATLVQQRDAPGPLPRAQGDFFMAALVLLARRVTGIEAAPTRVGFRHAAPTDTEPVRALFRCPVDYRASENSITFPANFLRVPSREADAGLATIVAEHAALLSNELPAEPPLLARIKRHLAPQLCEAPNRRDVARALGMSERTLQRRLAELGTTFQAVIEAVRIDVATQLLRDDTRTLDEIAAEVGLSGGRSLARVFRRATGRAPSELRAETRGGRGSALRAIGSR